MHTPDQVCGHFVELDGRPAFRIDHAEQLPPFLVPVVGASDVWCFVSTAGALTAGRGHAEHAMLPYETEDRLHRAAGQAGSYAVLQVERDGVAPCLWRPFGRITDPLATRALVKTLPGDTLVLEERRADLGLTYRCAFRTSARFGLIRTVSLQLNDDAAPCRVSVVDGLRALLPFGVGTGLQQSASVLADAYKLNELDPTLGRGIYSLSAHIIDRAEPAECLRATVAWTRIDGDAQHLLAARDEDAALRGETPSADARTAGCPGDLLVAVRLALAPGEGVSWRQGLDTGLDRAAVVALDAMLASGDIDDAVAADMDADARELELLIARADGAQRSADPSLDARHLSNVLFNCMRGGVPPDDLIDVADVVAFVSVRHRRAGALAVDAFATLPAHVPRAQLLAAADATADTDLIRLCTEYLPITFSRRHGDPSRPWNRFHIRVRNEDGSRRLAWEGNWRDVFQNHEAMCLSFPQYIESVVTTFLDASTADGFNPYRISREGIDWEVPEPEDPWGNIGYWGDHQIIYLVRLLELARAHGLPFLRRLDRRIYTWADVPYRLRSFDELVADPHHTIVFDRELQRQIEARVERVGMDGRLRHAGDHIERASLADKMLVPLLARLGNLVVGGGIWMNTQRPEWNDANNALVGNGISMVTHAYVLRYVRFIDELIAGVDTPLPLAGSIARWLTDVAAILASTAAALARGALDDIARRDVLEQLGRAFEAHRARVYEGALDALQQVPVADVRAMLADAARVIEYGVRASRRDDGLYEAYNLLHIDAPDRARVETLYPMLEGQVAVLSTDALDADETIALVDALYDSALYRPDQRSFLLYPERALPSFVTRGVVPTGEARAVPLLARLLDAGDRSLLVRDADGVIAFAPDLRNARDVRAALAGLASDPELSERVQADTPGVLALYEKVFQHHGFTGRSGTMVAYEGLGCIYWHMVSKLLVAVQERFVAARDAGASPSTQRALAERYHRLRDGLGFRRSVASNGGFPTDAYSHTGPDGNARQPGMTGQVKEDIITRRGELGVRVHEGCVSFDPALLDPAELLDEPAAWTPPGREQCVDLPAGSLGFTVCRTPVVYHVGEGPACVVIHRDNGSTRVDGAVLGRADSDALLYGDDIERVDVHVLRDTLLLSTTR